MNTVRSAPETLVRTACPGDAGLLIRSESQMWVSCANAWWTPQMIHTTAMTTRLQCMAMCPVAIKPRIPHWRATGPHLSLANRLTSRSSPTRCHQPPVSPLEGSMVQNKPFGSHFSVVRKMVVGKTEPLLRYLRRATKRLTKPAPKDPRPHDCMR